MRPAANAHRFILQQPKGYDTLIGEKASSCQEDSASVSRLPVPWSKMLYSGSDEATSALILNQKLRSSRLSNT